MPRNWSITTRRWTSKWRNLLDILWPAVYLSNVLEGIPDRHLLSSVDTYQIDTVYYPLLIPTKPTPSIYCSVLIPTKPALSINQCWYLPNLHLLLSSIHYLLSYRTNTFPCWDQPNRHLLSSVDTYLGILYPCHSRYHLIGKFFPPVLQDRSHGYTPLIFCFHSYGLLLTLDRLLNPQYLDKL